MRRTAWLLWRVHLTFRQMASRQGMGAYLALVLLRNMPKACWSQCYHPPSAPTIAYCDPGCCICVCMVLC